MQSFPFLCVIHLIISIMCFGESEKLSENENLMK